MIRTETLTSSALFVVFFAVILWLVLGIARLADLAKELGETTNRYFQQPELVKELKTLLEETKARDRSRP